MPPTEKVGNQWDPPPPTSTVYVAGGAMALLAAIAVALGYCELGAALAGVATVLGLVHVTQVSRMDIPLPPPRPGEPVEGSGGWPPDPPPPHMLMSMGLKSASTAFALSGGIVAMTDCCEIAALLLGLSVLTAGLGVAVGRPRGTSVTRR